MAKEEMKIGEIVVFQSKTGAIELKGDFRHETIWATQADIVKLYGKDQSVISRHIASIFKDKEVDSKSNMQKMHTANSDKPVVFYGLDIILAVGYRTNSKRAIEFRQWATKIIKQHLIKGYTLNEKRLLQTQDQFRELQETISFLREKSGHKLLAGQEKEILDLLESYSKTLSLLEKYDKEKLKLAKKGKATFAIDDAGAKIIIGEVKKKLLAKKEASCFFGQENGDKFKAVLGNIYQTFAKKELYPSLEAKAAHLLYFLIKDHPFVDGNKRIGSFLFVYFLDRNRYLLKKSGERKINDNALTALSLLIAVSDPKEKDKMIKIVTNLLAG